MADHHRHFGQAGFEQRHRRGDPQARGQPVEPLLPELGRAAHSACGAGAAQPSSSPGSRRWKMRTPAIQNGASHGRHSREAAIPAGCRRSGGTGKPLTAQAAAAPAFAIASHDLALLRQAPAKVRPKPASMADHRQAGGGIAHARRRARARAQPPAASATSAPSHKRVKQRPAERVRGRRSHPGFEQCHRVPFSYSSSSRRSSASSFFDALRAESAPSSRRARRSVEGRAAAGRRPVAAAVHSRGRRGLVDVRALLLVAAHQALLGHDLQRLEHGGVLRRLAGGDDLVDVADGGRPAAPQDGQDFEFGVGRLAAALPYTKTLLR